MWPRLIEIALGAWLAVSALVLDHGSQSSWLWINDLLCGVAVVTLAALSFWPRARRAYLGELLIGCWLVGAGIFAAAPESVVQQSEILTGLLLLQFAILPTEANRPPRSWREFQQRAKPAAS